MHRNRENANSQRLTPRPPAARVQQDNQLNGCRKSLIIALNEKIAPKTKTDPKPPNAQKPYKSLWNGRHADAPTRCSESNRAKSSRPSQATTRTDEQKIIIGLPDTRKRTRNLDAYTQDSTRTSGHLESLTRKHQSWYPNRTSGHLKDVILNRTLDTSKMKFWTDIQTHQSSKT